MSAWASAEEARPGTGVGNVGGAGTGATRARGAAGLGAGPERPEVRLALPSAPQPGARPAVPSALPSVARAIEPEEPTSGATELRLDARTAVLPVTEEQSPALPARRKGAH